MQELYECIAVATEPAVPSSAHPAPSSCVRPVLYARMSDEIEVSTEQPTELSNPEEAQYDDDPSYVPSEADKFTLRRRGKGQETSKKGRLRTSMRCRLVSADDALACCRAGGGDWPDGWL